MTITLSRRLFLGAACATLLGCSKRTSLDVASSEPLARLEGQLGGRVGVCALDTGTGRVLTHRADERFAMCSTFKWVLAAAILQRVERGELALSRPIPFGDKELLDYAPVTRANVGRGSMTIAELAEAAVTVSDNTAANLLLELLGGPAGMTRFLRDHGDSVTRLDRNEPTMSSNEPNDARDTTSPRAMVATLQTLLLTPALTEGSRQTLLGWMASCKTGLTRLRAGLPPAWRVVDKTGTGQCGSANDVAVAWPPGRSPILIAAYLSDSQATKERLDAAHAEIGRLAATL